MRANSERLAPPQVVADNCPLRRTMIQEVFLQIIVLARPLRAACQPEAANRGRNVT